MSTARLHRFLPPLVLVLLAAACETEPLPPTSVAAAPAPAQAYVLGSGDKIHIVVFGEDTLSGDYLVGGDGRVALPLVGAMQASGLTTTALETGVADQLKRAGLVVSPKVSAAVTEYRPYYILGEVTKPGQYPFAVGMTVTKAVAMAGGFTYRANDRMVFVTREGARNEAPISVTAATWVGPGDTIRVAERMF